jgi:hypothetical protein
MRHVVQRVARSALHGLQERRLRVPRHQLSKGPAIRGFSEEGSDGQSDHPPVRHLLQGAAGRGAISEEHADAEHAFAADRRDLDQAAVAHLIRHRVDAAVGKVHMVDASAVRVQCVPDERRAQSQVSGHAVVFDGGQRREQLVLQQRAVRKESRRWLCPHPHDVSSESA